MAIGYACICIGDHNRMKSLRLAGSSAEKLDAVYSHNLKVLRSNILYNREHGIKLFRISSDIFPLITHEDICYDWEHRFSDELSALKKLISDSGIKVSMHPGQYTVLNSCNEAVVWKAVKEIDYHSNFLSCVSGDERAPVIVHIGSAGGGKEAASKRFITNYLRLSDDSRKRLCIENDEKVSTAKDVYETACVLGIPCIFDNLHNMINPSFDLPDKEIISLFSKTFSGRRQKIHYSGQDPDKRTGAHSPTIYHKAFTEYYLDVGGEGLDIMLEVKDKDLSCVKCMNCTGEGRNDRYSEWARYKYFVMEKDAGIYRDTGKLFSGNRFTYAGFYDLIEKAAATKTEKGGAVNALMHVWGYFKDKADENEKRRYSVYMEKLDKGLVRAARVKEFLFSLALKYDEEYLKKAIYFFSGIYDR